MDFFDENLAEHSDDGTGPVFSTTGIQQLHQDQHLLQTVGTGRTRYISRELRMQQVIAHHPTSPFLPRKTITTDGARSHGLNEFNGHFRLKIHRLRE